MFFSFGNFTKKPSISLMHTITFLRLLTTSHQKLSTRIARELRSHISLTKLFLFFSLFSLFFRSLCKNISTMVNLPFMLTQQRHGDDHDVFQKNVCTPNMNFAKYDASFVCPPRLANVTTTARFYQITRYSKTKTRPTHFSLCHPQNANQIK